MPASEEKQLASPASLPGTGEVLLVVEDEASLRRMLENLFKKNGYAPIVVPDGASALEVWREKSDQIDLVLTDMVMPGGMSGGDLAKKLQTDCPDLPVIISSGFSPELLTGKMNLKEGRQFLQKPYTNSLLLETVRASLDARRNGAGLV